MAELLSPAGNLEKMKAAFLYGADAVYLAGQMFGMRAAADNFSLQELSEAVSYAHARGKRIYLTVNTMPREQEYPLLERYFSDLRGIGVDALIIADLGVLQLAKRILPETELHISTQANTVSAATCRAWYDLGVKRVVLARELTLEEIRAIRANIPHDLELEAFIHGSMCISYSGRCLLSNFLIGRDANRGMCAQPCRWNYTVQPNTFLVTEEKRPDVPLEIIEDRGESFVMSSKDLCMIDHIPELMESGIQSFKIEGRMKSAYYTAVVTNTYRMAIRDYENGIRSSNGDYLRELQSVSHREYDTGYFFDRSTEDAKTCRDAGYIREKAYLATVLSYNAMTGEALCIQKNKLTVGDRAELLSPMQVGIPFTVGSLWDEAHAPIESAPHPQMKFYMQMPFAVKEGDIIRSGGEEADA